MEGRDKLLIQVRMSEFGDRDDGLHLEPSVILVHDIPP